jgi:cyclophilin family peptidyl-prolyl cis-trans isomerase
VSPHSRRKLSYAGCAFHALVAEMALFGGDTSAKNNGTGGESIYGYDFEDRSGLADGAPKHDRPGVLSMGNPNDKPPGYDAQEWAEQRQQGRSMRDWPSFGSRFSIYLDAEPDGLDGRHPVVGIVVDGLQLLREVAQTPVDMAKGAKRRPLVPVVIASCGAVD